MRAPGGRSKLPTPAERELGLKKGISWGIQFESLKEHKAWQRLDKQIRHELERANKELMSCGADEILEKREQVKAFQYVLDFIERFIRLGRVARDELEKLKTEEAQNHS